MRSQSKNVLVDYGWETTLDSSYWKFKKIKTSNYLNSRKVHSDKHKKQTYKRSFGCTAQLQQLQPVVMLISNLISNMTMWYPE